MRRRSTLRDLLGSILDTIAYHPCLDRVRFTRFRIWWWRHFDKPRYASLTRINLGCGPNLLEGFCNVDVVGPADIHFNLLNAFPLPSGASHFVYCEHVLEHFHVDNVQHILHEVHRVLEPGGVFRVSVPNVRSTEDGTTGPRVWRLDEAKGDVMELNRRIFNHGHKAIFTFGLLARLLHRAGFTVIAAVKERKSAYLEEDLIQRIEHRTTGNIVVEARK